MEYTVDYFINKFKNIPEELWCTNKLGSPGEARCALGHCLIGNSLDINVDHEAIKLSGLFKQPISMVHVVNNGDDFKYQQSTPKQRILASLYDIKFQNTGCKVSDTLIIPVELLNVEVDSYLSLEELLVLN